MPRLTNKDINESIHHSKVKIKDNFNGKRLESGQIIFDKAGNVQEQLPDDQIMAKELTSSTSKRYFVRINRRNDLYNPYDRDYAAESYRIARLEGISPFNLIVVDKNTFDSYVAFLKSADVKLLNQAQRGI